MKFLKFKNLNQFFMKNLLLSFSFLFLLAFTSCSKKDDTPADPEGTIPTTINFTVNSTPITLYQGVCEDAPSNYCKYAIVWFGMDGSLNAATNSHSSEVADFSSYCGIHSPCGDFASVGKVGGLGAVTDIPTSGWATTVGIEKGYGYVLRYRHTYLFTTSTLPYHYCRFYVVDWLKSTSGGLIGAKIKYQNEFH